MIVATSLQTALILHHRLLLLEAVLETVEVLETEVLETDLETAVEVLEMVEVEAEVIKVAEMVKSLEIQDLLLHGVVVRERGRRVNIHSPCNLDTLVVVVGGDMATALMAADHLADHRRPELSRLRA